MSISALKALETNAFTKPNVLADQLHTAAKINNLQALKELIENNKDIIDAKDMWGYTALHRAIINGYNESAIWLIENGADINAEDNGNRNSLFLAAQTGNEKIAKLLLEKGCIIKNDRFGLSPQVIAKRTENYDIACMINEHLRKQKNGEILSKL